jgi:hypothetical protein
MPFPETFPAFSALRTDSEGNLWVKEFARPTDSASRWAVFAPDGRWLGTLSAPLRFIIYQIGPDFVVGRALDEMDVERVVMFRLDKGADNVARRVSRP